MSRKAREVVPSDEPPSAPLTRATGDPAGRKGRETRARLVAELERRCVAERPSEVTVAQIAAAAGTSAATFYTYFPDIAGAVAEIATRHLEQFDEVLELARAMVLDGASFESCERFVNGYFAFWEPRPGLLEAIIVASPDEDPRFFRVLLRAMFSVTYTLVPLVHDGDPLGVAAPLVTMISHAAARRSAFARDGITHDKLVDSLARILHAVLGRPTVELESRQAVNTDGIA